MLDAAVVLTALELGLELLLDDELELELELELGAACNRAGASTAASGRSALPESWLAAAKPAAPATKPSAAAAATAARLVNPRPTPVPITIEPPAVLLRVRMTRRAPTQGWV